MDASNDRAGIISEKNKSERTNAKYKN